MRYKGYVVSYADEQLKVNKENFFVNGRAKDVNIEMQKHKVLLAPIPYGAGIKGKFIDAMRNRLPSVTTQLGSESMQENTLWNGFICDSDEDFIDPEDKVFYCTALAGEAYLVTGNIKHYPQSSIVITPSEFLTLSTWLP